MNLETLRIKAGWSKTFVANRLGVSRQTIANWESGENVPTGKNIVKLCDLYGVTAKELGVSE